MTYHFQRGIRADLPRVYELIDQRIHWMDEKGIRQWNVTDYWGCYPPAHYERAVDMGCLYVLRQAGGVIVAVAVLWEEDERWHGDSATAYYVHHLTTALGERGAGEIMLAECYALARRQGKEFLRLDCAVDNPVLNAYYQRQGFEPAGQCVDGLYKGVLRQKGTKKLRS